MRQTVSWRFYSDAAPQCTQTGPAGTQPWVGPWATREEAGAEPCLIAADTGRLYCHAIDVCFCHEGRKAVTGNGMHWH